MAEQFWYTSCPVGIKQINGWQTRAASDNLLPAMGQVEAALQGCVTYKLPAGGTSYNTTPEQAPVAMMLVDSAAGRALARRVFLGFNHDNRPGNYFAHVVTSLPPTLNAKDAIELWQAPFWRESYAELDVRDMRLPPLRDELLHPALTPFSTVQLRPRELRDALVALVARVLSSEGAKDATVFIAAPPADVALLIWGLCRCLPPKLLAGLTFSTYEESLTRSGLPAVVGTCRLDHLTAADVPFDLPPPCYRHPNAVISLYKTTRVTQTLPASDILAFAEYAVGDLLDASRADGIGAGDAQPGQESKRDKVFRFAAEISAADVPGLLAAHKLLASDPAQWAHDTVSQLLKSPAITLSLLEQDDFCRRLVGLGMADVAWWQTHVPQAIAPLRSRSGPFAPNQITQLRTLITTMAQDALLRGQLDDATRLLDNLYPAVDNTKSGWLSLRERFLPADLKHLRPARISEIRIALLRHWAVLNSLPSTTLDPWLDVGPEEIGPLLHAMEGTPLLAYGVEYALRTRAYAATPSLPMEFDTEICAALARLSMVQGGQAVVYEFLNWSLRDKRCDLTNYLRAICAQGNAAFAAELLTQYVRTDDMMWRVLQDEHLLPLLLQQIQLNPELAARAYAFLQWLSIDHCAQAPTQVGKLAAELSARNAETSEAFIAQWQWIAKIIKLAQESLPSQPTQEDFDSYYGWRCTLKDQETMQIERDFEEYWLNRNLRPEIDARTAAARLALMSNALVSLMKEYPGKYLERAVNSATKAGAPPLTAESALKLVVFYLEFTGFGEATASVRLDSLLRTRVNSENDLDILSARLETNMRARMVNFLITLELRQRGAASRIDGSLRTSAEPSRSRWLLLYEDFKRQYGNPGLLGWLRK